MIRRFAALVAALVLSRPSAAQLPVLEPGLRLRVTTAPNAKKTIIGTLMSQSKDTLTITSGPTRWHHLVPSDVRRIDVSGGDSRLGGAAKGLIAGAMMMGGLTFVVVARDAKDPYMLVKAFGVGGAFVGTFVGFSIGTERWTPIFGDKLPRDNRPFGPPRSPYGTSP